MPIPPPTPVIVSCPHPTLAPGLSEVCTSTYTVTQADVDSGQASDTCTGSYTTTSTDVTNGSVANDGTATGNDVDFGNTFTDDDTLTIPYTDP